MLHKGVFIKFANDCRTFEFTEKIIFWRRSDRRESARLRMEHLREELKEAAKNGDAKALRKVKRKRKADKVRSAAYRKRKRKEKR